MRILLVEDAEKVSRFIVRGPAAERFAVDAVFDGASGLEYAQATGRKEQGWSMEV